MSLFIESYPDPRLTTATVAALHKLCEDPGLTIDFAAPERSVIGADARVTLADPTVLTEECYRIKRLIDSPISVVIRSPTPARWSAPGPWRCPSGTCVRRSSRAINRV
jgi:hypothetical protein